MIDIYTSINVLHVDDDPEQAELTASFLERKNEEISVEIASSADEGLDLLAEGEYDCIVSDYDMPGVDGLQFLKTVREEYVDLPFIFFTGKGVDEIASEAIAYDVSEYLQKSGETSQYKDLANKIERSVRRHQGVEKPDEVEQIQHIIKEVYKRIATAKDREEIERDICEAFAESDPYSSVWIGDYNPDNQRVEPRTVAGVNGESVEPIQITTDENTTDVGSITKAVRDEKIAVLQDVSENSTNEPEWEGALELDHRSTLVIPLLQADTLYGVVNVNSSRANAFTEQERRLLTEFGSDIAQILSETGEQTNERCDNDGREDRLGPIPQLQGIVDHAGHVVMITDSEGTIEYVNDAFEETTGYSASEAVGQTPAILQSDEHDEEFYQDMWETLLSGDVWQGEVVNERKDGSQYVIDQTVAPITDANQEITRFVAVNHEITDRKKRELNLSFLKRAIDQAGIGIGTYDSEGYPTYVNQHLTEILGTDAEELKDLHLTELDPNLNHHQFRDYWESFDDGERRIYDTHLKRLDTSEQFPAEIMTSRVTIEGTSYQVNTVRDATEQKEREWDLERFQSAVEHAGHGVVITDSEGIIEYVNDAFEEISGYSASEVIGRTPALLQSGEHDEEFYRDMWETLLSGDVWQGEVVNERKNGSRYVIDQTIAPITDADEGTTGFVSVNRDISELKEYEQELENQNERLEEFGHTVAHDLRNPLNLFQGKLEKLRATAKATDGDVDTEAVCEHCDDLVQVVHRMEVLIEELLTMAEQGQLVLNPEEHSLQTVAEKAWKQVETETADLSVKDTSVDADSNRLRELLSNLFRNTIEHAGEDATVEIGPLNFTDGFYVEDNGPGIPEDDRERVLERGYTTEEAGTGFGLAIVKEVAQAHGWEVSITEAKDGGARFEFRVVD